MRSRVVLSITLAWLVLQTLSRAAEVDGIVIDAGKELHGVSQLLTGACIEDVNHEIYGGLYSQMVFGESFQEPAVVPQIEGFATYGGDWLATDGVLHGPAGRGHKIISNSVVVADGSVRVDVRFEDATGGNAGLIVRTSKPGVGADRFVGYELALDPARQIVRIGRHRNDFTLLRDVACPVAVGTWITLQVNLRGSTLSVTVDGVERAVIEDTDPKDLMSGSVGLRRFQRSARLPELGDRDQWQFLTAAVPATRSE